MKPIITGVAVLEMFMDPPQPYKLWQADVYACRGCDLRIVTGFGDNPIAQHFEDDFEIKLEYEKTHGVVYYSYEKPQIEE